MESTRPIPVKLAQFQQGQSRDSVREELGAPKGSANEADGATCDFYDLYTHGYGSGGKVGLAFLEGAADVVTLGLAEVVNTPVEGATRNAIHPVTFCYKDNKLARISESGRQVTAWEPAPAAEPASATVQTSPTPATQTPAAAQTSASGAPQAAAATGLDLSKTKAAVPVSSTQPAVSARVVPAADAAQSPHETAPAADWQQLPHSP